MAWVVPVVPEVRRAQAVPLPLVRAPTEPMALMEPPGSRAIPHWAVPRALPVPMAPTEPTRWRVQTAETEPLAVTELSEPMAPWEPMAPQA